MLNYNEVVNQLFSMPKFTKKNDLNNTRHLLNMLNRQKRDLKIIHVAGTNGKGSVCAFIANVLKESNINFGLFTSPHLIKVNERIKINNEEIDNDKFVNAFCEVKKHVEEMCTNGFNYPSFFEYIFAMAMYIFYESDVEYVILETGLGGRLDATNSLFKKELSIITSIGLDHTEILGDTIEKIALEKADIIRKDTPVIYNSSDIIVKSILEKKINEIGAVGYSISKDNYKIKKNYNKYIDFCVNCEYYVYDNVKILMKAKYQVENAILSMLALNILMKNENKISHETIKSGISTTIWEGRMEEVSHNIIVDGAHNIDGIKRFIESINDFYKNNTKTLIFSVVNDKDYTKMIRLLCEEVNFNNIIITQLNSNRGVLAPTLSKIFKQYTNANIEETITIEEAIKLSKKLSKEEEIIFCAGSLYLVGEIKDYLISNEINNFQEEL